ncbi:MAG: SRPBCC family protein [Chitinophagales bacterium]|nr:SRPBCC family protein [Chitinophagales bacterium]
MKKLFLLFIPMLMLFSCKKEYKVERSIEIDAPQDLVWEQIKYFQNWKSWSPWYASDTAMQWTFKGTDGEPESSYSWESEKSGSGTMTNTGTTEGEQLKYHVLFKKPWESQTDGHLDLSTLDNGKTKVTWAFEGVNKGIMSLFLNMDKMVGPDFEKGLKLLKEHAEALAKEQPKASALIKTENYSGKTFIGIKEETDITGISTFYATNFEKIMATGIKMEGGYPSGIYYTWDMENMKTNLAAAIPVASNTQAPVGTEKITLPAGKVLVYDYYGDYENMMKAHEEIEIYMTQNNIEYKGPVLEEYITDPMEEKDPSKWLTKIYYFVK